MSGHLVLMCGRSFSGKSTAAHALAEALPAEIISFDQINEERGLRGGEGVPVEEWGRTYSIARARAADALRRGATIVVDDTSSPRFLRDGWRETAHAAEATLVLVYIDADHRTIKRRQRANRVHNDRHDVRDEVMIDHLAAFEPPGPDERPLRFEAEKLSVRQVTSLVMTALTETPTP